MDGVLTDSVAAVVSCYNEDFQYYSDFKEIRSCDIHTYDFQELTLASKEYVDHLWNRPRFFSNLKLMPFAREVLEILSIQYNIEVATAGYSPNLRQKEAYLHKHLPFIIKKIDLINLKEFKDKSHLDMNNAVFIDDQANNLITSNAALKICFGDKEEWNTTWNGERCYNWHEVMKRLFDVDIDSIAEVWNLLQKTMNQVGWTYGCTNAESPDKIAEYTKWATIVKKGIVDIVSGTVKSIGAEDMESFLLFAVDEMDSLHTVMNSGNSDAMFKRVKTTCDSLYSQFIKSTKA